MERILTTQQMRDCDKYTIETLGVPEETLIERAGKAIAEEIKSRFKGGRVLVCAGEGNNGNDGRVVAKILQESHGFTVFTLNVANGLLRLFDKPFDIIVDCIFGTGLNRSVEGKYKKCIDKINSYGAYVISCDIPSGINGDTGKVMGVAVKANLTIAIQELKIGHFLNDAIDYCGEIVCKDIGISVWDDNFILRPNDFDLSRTFSERDRNSHKGMYGKSALIGGSKNYTGSVILSSMALCSLKMGTGYAHLEVPESLFNSFIGLVPECTLSSFKDDEKGIIFDKSHLDTLLNYDSIVIGMGMGINKGLYETISYLLKNYTGTLIIDADGLNTLSKYGIEILSHKKCKVILTPHIGEFKRLTGLEKDDILDNQIEFAKNFASKFDLVLLLKNAVSIITDGNVVYINTTGVSGMAKAGSGDVLSGFIAGISARVDDALDSAICSSYLFGKAGELCLDTENNFTMTATDIIKKLPEAINNLVK